MSVCVLGSPIHQSLNKTDEGEKKPLDSTKVNCGVNNALYSQIGPEGGLEEIPWRQAEAAGG